MPVDPYYDAHRNPLGPLAGGWGHAVSARRPGGPAAGMSAESPAEDAVVRVGGWVLAALGVVVLAAAALVVAALAYGVATWRRWRWWPLALGAVAGAGLAVVAMGVTVAAWAHHTLALRELTAPHPGRSLGALVAARWPAWLAAQVPLSVPAGLLAAALARHQVQCVAAHELSPAAQRRREREAGARTARAARRATGAPATHRGRPVLGAWVSGDFAPWRSGVWCALPDGALGLGWVVLGLPGTGKTETLLRLAQLGLAAGYDVHVIDAKGERATQQRFAALCASTGVAVRLFPAEPYDGFRGGPDALRNRLGRVVDYTEPFYQDGARDLLAAVCGAPGGPPRSLAALLEALPAATLEGLDPAVRRGTLARYRSFGAAAAGALDGTWAFEDTRASYLLLDGVALGDDAPRLARFLVEDFAHYAAARKDPGRRALLLVDEFSALRLPNAAPILERLRSFGVGVVIAAQSVEGLHDDEGERARLLGAASTLLAHRLADPDPVVARSGTVRRPERSHQLDGHAATGAGSLRLQDTYRIDPNELRCLPAGVAYVVADGHAAKVAVSRAPMSGDPVDERRRKGQPAGGERAGIAPEERRTAEEQVLPRGSSPFTRGF